MLYSYVIKVPKYLETEECIKQYNEELAEKKAKQEQLNNKIHIKSQSSIQDKLKNLKELKDQQLITDEEYADKKAQLLELI